MYAVVIHPSGVNVGLVTAKVRLAKQGLTITRLDIITSSTPQSQAEVKVAREIFAAAHVVTVKFDGLLPKFALWKA